MKESGVCYGIGHGQSKIPMLVTVIPGAITRNINIIAKFSNLNSHILFFKMKGNKKNQKIKKQVKRQIQIFPGEKHKIIFKLIMTVIERPALEMGLVSGGKSEKKVGEVNLQNLSSLRIYSLALEMIVEFRLTLIFFLTLDV